MFLWIIESGDMRTKYSFFPSGIRAWNGLPDQTRKTNNLTSFKTLIKLQDQTQTTDERRTQYSSVQKERL